MRVCDDTVFRNRERPCILYQIKRCSGPCVNNISESNYKKTVIDAIDFISGKSRKIQKNLSKDMEQASKDLDFEKAAIARDRIKALTQIQMSQKINQTNLNEADVISIYKSLVKHVFKYFFLDLNKIGEIKLFYPKHDSDENIKEILTSFLTQFYENKSVPSLILTNTDIKDLKLLEKTFSTKENKNVIIKKAKIKMKSIFQNLLKKMLNKL